MRNRVVASGLRSVMHTGQDLRMERRCWREAACMRRDYRQLQREYPGVPLTAFRDEVLQRSRARRLRAHERRVWVREACVTVLGVALLYAWLWLFLALAAAR
jgi:hypothetical protein